MADETLKIRVDVETAKVGELKGAIKSLNAEINVASREELPALIAQKQELTSTLNKLVPKSESFTQTVKDARKEARVFRFALLEMVHGLDGLGTAFGALTGAGEETQKSIKVVTASMQEGLGAGLGLKFGLDAMGGSFAALAGPIGIAVGALTVIGGLFAHHQEQMKAEHEQALKLTDAYLDLEKQLGKLTRSQMLNNAEADISLAKQKEVEARTKAKATDMAFVMSGGLFGESPQARANAAQEALNAVEKAELAKKKLLEEFTKEDLKIADDARKTEKEHHDEYWRAFFADMKEKQEHVRKIMLDIKGGVGAQGVHVHEVRGAAEGMTFEEIMGGWNMGIDVLMSGFNALSASIHNGLVSAFGAANSMFQQFVIGVLDGIARIAEQIAASAIIAGIFSLFGMPFGAVFHGLTGFASGGTLYEPVVGIGASGRAYSFAENGPERIGSLTSFGNSSGGGNMAVSGEFRIRGRDLYASVKQNQVIDRKRGGS